VGHDGLVPSSVSLLAKNNILITNGDFELNLVMERSIMRVERNIDCIRVENLNFVNFATKSSSKGLLNSLDINHAIFTIWVSLDFLAVSCVNEMETAGTTTTSKSKHEVHRILSFNIVISYCLVIL